MGAGKTKGFFHKTFQLLTKLLSCGSCREHGTKVVNGTDRFPCGEWQGEFSEETFKEEEEEEEEAAELKVAGSSERRKKQGSRQLETMTMSEGEFELARRMKELEMMDASDMEQVLDVEEALHYYSRLKSPVYVEIVDRFFMDMYNDFSTPPWPSPQLQRQHPSALSKCSTSSRRRLGSIRC